MKNEQEKNSVGKNYFFNLLASIFDIILPLITTPFVSRVLGVENIGIYSFTFSFITIIVMIGAMGSATHGQRYIAMYQDDIKNKSKGFYEIFLLRVITLSISLLLFLVIVFIYQEYLIYFLIQIPYFIGMIFDISWFFRGNDEFDKLSLKNIFYKILGLVLIFCFVNDTNDLWIYLLILSCSNLLSHLSMWTLIPKRVVGVSLNEIDIGKHFKDTLVYFVPTIAYQLYSIIDKVILGFAASEIETGYYEQAYKIIHLATTLLSSYNVVIRTRMSYLCKQISEDDDKKEELNNTINGSLNFILMFACPITVGIFMISPNFTLWFFGEDFIKVSGLLQLFSVMILLNSLRGLIGALIFVPFGIQNKANISQCTAALANVILTLCLIPTLQSYGAVLSSIIAELIILIMYLIFTSKHIEFKNILFPFIKYFIISILMALSIIWVDTLFDGIICTVIQVGLGCVVYFAILIILRDKMIFDFFTRLKENFSKKEEV